MCLYLLFVVSGVPGVLSPPSSSPVLVPARSPPRLRPPAPGVTILAPLIINNSPHLQAPLAPQGVLVMAGDRVFFGALVGSLANDVVPGWRGCQDRTR